MLLLPIASARWIDAVLILRYSVLVTKIEVRTDKTLKRDVQHILADLGLDLSTAVNMFLVQVRLRKGIPFPILTDNGLTKAQERQLLRDLADAKSSRKHYASGKQVLTAILGQ